MKSFLFLTVLVALAVRVQAADEIEVGVFSATMGTAPYTQVVSHGLGETPKAVIVWTTKQASQGTQNVFNVAIGVTDGTTDRCVAGSCNNAVGTSNTSTRVTTKLITILNNFGNIDGEAVLQSWDSSGFTLSWTNSPGENSDIQYMIFGGAGISASVNSWTSPTSTGDQAITGVGFQPDLVMHFYSAVVTSLDTKTDDLDFGFGVMEATGDEWALAAFSEDNLGTTNTRSGQQSDATIHSPSGASPYLEASFVSMDADGFTVNFNTIAAASYNVSLSLSGVVSEATSFSKSTSGAPASQEIDGHAFAPQAVFFGSFQEPSATGAVSDAKFGLGAGDGTSEGNIALFAEDNVGTTNAERSTTSR